MPMREKGNVGTKTNDYKLAMNAFKMETARFPSEVLQQPSNKPSKPNFKRELCQFMKGIMIWCLQYRELSLITQRLFQVLRCN